MINFIDKIIEYWQFPFVKYAFISGILIAVSSSLLGLVLVLKRYSHIGTSLSNVAFGSMSMASVIGLTKEIYLILPVTVASSVILLKKSKSHFRSDASLAMISLFFLALGYILMNVFKSGPNVAVDVCTTLFGSLSILTLTKTDVLICLVLASIIILFFIFYYNKIFLLTFDESYAKASGLNLEKLNFMLAIIIALTISISLRLVGSLLVCALMVFPTMTAVKICRSFKSISIFVAISSILMAVFGICVSIVFGFPVGPTIVFINALVFMITSIIGKRI